MSPPRKSTAFYTADDAKASFALFCCVCGIGTLGMPANFARAGPVLAVIALLFMAASNIYATVTLSKLMLLAPKSVKTYSDLGEWVMGKPGRYLALTAQMGVCLMIPCAFLVLGSQLFEVLFPTAFSQTYWVVFMAAVVFPIALMPTMKESAGMMLAGSLGTVVADIVGISVLLHEMSGHPAPPSPDINLDQVVTVFGNLALAYGAAIVVPDLQREHSEPHRMPKVIFVTLSIISCFFLALAALGYSAAGCQMSGNMLFSIAGSGTSGLTTLGFTANRGSVVMAYLFMQLHLTVAFSTFMHPTFYMLERLILGMHKEGLVSEDDHDQVEKLSYVSVSTPSIHSKSVTSVDLEQNAERRLVVVQPADELAEYRGTRNVLRYVLLRTALIVVLVIVSVVLRKHFLELSDFIGASAHSTSCLILPLVFYLKVCWKKIPLWERAIALFVIVVCIVCGIYVSIQAGKELFGGDEVVTPETPVFPFCKADHQFQSYYVKNASSST
ncbi:Amino acid/auxin permease, partial [Globisporangium splendens]